MDNSGFVKYLNSLQSENAIGESQQNNPFFHSILVERPVGKFLAQKVENEEPHTILLTGHAGDGKTSLLLQVLRELGLSNLDTLKPYDLMTLPNGKNLRYIKDFSELSADNRIELLNLCLNESKDGIYSILIANTGPLLNTFRAILGDEAEMQVINAVDENSAKILQISGYNILAINIAGIDNTSFVKPFMENVIAEQNWVNCKGCNKADVCSIYFNKRLLSENSQRAISFISNSYVWLQEHGKRLTIRQITAHLSYAITGGLDCGKVSNGQSKRVLFDYLFSNLLFGYRGVKDNKSIQLKAIAAIKTNRYDQKKTLADENLFIKRNYEKLPIILRSLCTEAGLRLKYCPDWQASVKRMYMLFNIETNNDKNQRLLQDLFSIRFPRFMQIRSGASANSDDKALVMDALATIFSGYAEKSGDRLAITMRRESGVMQSVQMVLGMVYDRDLKLLVDDFSGNTFGELPRKVLKLKICGKTLVHPLKLPLLNYFEDVRNGIISTNIDPQLSHGIDSIKAQVLAICNSQEDNDEMELLVMATDKWTSRELYYEEKNWLVR
jgi:hypothetical protein